MQTTEDEPLSVILLISSVAVSSGSPFWGLHALLHPCGTEELPCQGFPARGSQDIFQKDHNKGNIRQKRAQLGKLLFPLHFLQRRNELLPLARVYASPFPGVPRWTRAHNAEPRKRSLQPKLAPCREELLPQRGDMDGVMC